MSEFDGFTRYVNEELPKRLSTTEDPLAVAAKKIPVTTGSGLAVAFLSPETFKTIVLEMDRVENTADMDKPVSLATLEALDSKLDKEDVREQLADILTGMGLTVDPETGDLVLDEGVLTF